MPPYDELIEGWMNWLLVEKNRQPSTIKSYKIDLNLFREYLLSIYNKEGFHFATPDEIRDFLKYCLDERDNSRRTIGRMVSALISFFQFAVSTGKIDLDPLQEIQYEYPPAKRLPIYLSKEELDLLLEAAGKVSPEFAVRNQAIIGVLAMSGLRVSELTGLNISDINFNGHIATLRVIGKGDKERRVPLSPRGRSLLRNYLAVRPQAPTQAVFLSKRKRRISRHTIHWLIKRVVNRLDLDPRISAHKLRHTFAMLAYEAGWDLFSLQATLGHSNPNTTAIYARASEAHLIKQMEEKDPFS